MRQGKVSKPECGWKILGTKDKEELAVYLGCRSGVLEGRS